MPAPTLHFWNWDAPVLDKAVAELARGWSGGELDLSHLVIIVPTAEAARRLKESLAVAVAGRDGVVTAPHVWPPEVALTWNVDREALAGRFEERLAWAKVLREARLAQFTTLFPVEPALSRDVWAAGAAETLRMLKHTLGGGGHTMRSVQELLRDGEEAGRWAELAELEGRYLAMLDKLGLKDEQEVKRRGMLQPVLPDGVRSVVVLAVADPPLLVREWLSKVGMEVSIFVHAPESLSGAFDPSGAPVARTWEDPAAIALPLEESHLHLATRAQDQARRAVALLRAMVEQGIPSAAGTCDPALNAHLESALLSGGVRAYDPAGRRARSHVLAHLLHAWHAVAQNRAWRAAASFLRNQDVLRAVCAADGPLPSDLLEWLDGFHSAHLPATLDDAIALCGANDASGKAVLRRVADELARWQRASCEDAVRGLLGWIFGAREFRTENDHEREFVELTGEVVRLAVELDAAAARFADSGVGRDTLMTWLFAELDGLAMADTRGEVDLILHGWLELLWEPAAGLVVCGFNEERVPGVLVADPFLPDALRARLGLPCQASRRARDAYLLTAMAEQRRAKGSLHVVLGRVSDDNDVLKPSRLLFRCPDKALPQRVKMLFPREDEAGEEPQPPHSAAWKLSPPWIDKPVERIAPTALRDYLACPFRFYLKHRLKMRSPVDAAQREMTGAGFGDLAHVVLGRFGRDRTLRDSAEEEEIAGCLERCLDALARERHGAAPLFAVRLQIESARQRLRAFARVQARLIEEGWRIMDAELETREWGIDVAEAVFDARLDRVDRHLKTNQWRVWDYKTRTHPESPKKIHTAAAKESHLADESQKWKCFVDADGRNKQWVDLQLPLYVWALQKHRGVKDVQAGYIHLPAAAGETGAEVWGELGEGDIEAAHSCAAEAVRRIRLGKFWPPSDEVAFDEFAELFLGDTSESVDENWLSAAGKGAA